MKRVFITLSLTLVLLLSFTSVFAEAPFVLDVDDSKKDFTEENAKLLSDGQKTVEEFYGSTGQGVIQSTPGIKEEIFLPMTHYYQDGQPWSKNIMQTCGSTIGEAGCAVTSFAMITSYYGYSDDPGEVNTKLGSYACPFSYANAGSKYSLSLVGDVHQSVSNDYAKSYILGALRNNRPVLVGLNGGSTHFVVAYGYVEEIYDPGQGFYGNKYYYIYDPWSPRDYYELDQYLNNGWSVNRLKVYDN